MKLYSFMPIWCINLNKTIANRKMLSLHNTWSVRDDYLFAIERQTKYASSSKWPAPFVRCFIHTSQIYLVFIFSRVHSINANNKNCPHYRFLLSLVLLLPLRCILKPVQIRKQNVFSLLLVGCCVFFAVVYESNWTNLLETTSQLMIKAQ